MAKWQSFNIVNYSVIGTIAGFIAFIVSWLLNFFRIPIYYTSSGWVSFSASVVDIDLRTTATELGYFKDIGNIIVNFLKSSFNFDVTAFLGIVVGFIALTLIGRSLVGYFNAKPNSRVFLSFILGGAVLGILIPFILGLPFPSVTLSVIAYSIILGIIMSLVLQLKSLNRLQE